MLCCVHSFWWNKLEDYKKQIHNTSTNKKSCLLFCFCLRIALDALVEVSPWPKSTNQCSDPKKKKTQWNSDPLGCFWLSLKLAIYLFCSRAETGGIIMLFLGEGPISSRLSVTWVSQVDGFPYCQIKLSMGRYFLVRWICIDKHLFYITSDTEQAIWIFTHVHVRIHI